jgi:hypothetical protein
VSFSIGKVIWYNDSGTEIWPFFVFKMCVLSMQEPLGDHWEKIHISFGHSWPHFRPILLSNIYIWQVCKKIWGMGNFRKAFFKTFDFQKSCFLSHFFMFFPFLGKKTFFSNPKKIVPQNLAIFWSPKKRIKTKVSL